MSVEIFIRNEEDAWATLKEALANEIEETAKIVFEGWPIFKLTIEGRDFRGTFPTRIMPPILELQKEIHRIYCQAKYNSDDIRKIKQSEKELLELIVHIEPGCTKFITDLFKILNEIIKNSKMNAKQAAILLISISAIIATTIGWKDWVSSRERILGKEVTVELSKQETKRLDLVVKALTKEPKLQDTSKFINDFKGNLSKRLKADDQIKINNIPMIGGTRAAEIVPNPRIKPSEIRIDGEFIINEVKFPKKFGEKYRFSVTRVSDNKSLTTDVAPEKITADKIEILKECSFEVKTVIMEINAKNLKGKIVTANVVSISWPDKAEQ